MNQNHNAKDQLIIALDVPDIREAEAIVKDIGHEAGFYKIGYQLAFTGGLSLARDLIRDGKQVFLDLKLLDIDNTVAKGVENIAKIGVSMLTIHAYPKAMKAAVAAAKGSDIILLGVTVLTSMDNDDLKEAGYGMTDPLLFVEKRAKQVMDAGMGGVVCSAQEAGKIRQIITKDMAVVTPGIRPMGSDPDDQKRIMTPSQAIQAGASHLVVGRPITTARDKKLATKMIIQQMIE